MSKTLYLEFTPECVIEAYCHGIFPMANGEDGGINWYLPDPRAVIPLEGLHVSRRLARRIRNGGFEIRFDTRFEEVMRACALERSDGNWISEEFIDLYGELHRMGFAHSVE